MDLPSYDAYSGPAPQSPFEPQTEAPTLALAAPATPQHMDATPPGQRPTSQPLQPPEAPQHPVYDDVPMTSTPSYYGAPTILMQPQPGPPVPQPIVPAKPAGPSTAAIAVMLGVNALAIGSGAYYGGRARGVPGGLAGALAGGAVTNFTRALVRRGDGTSESMLALTFGIVGAVASGYIWLKHTSPKTGTSSRVLRKNQRPVRVSRVEVDDEDEDDDDEE